MSSFPPQFVKVLTPMRTTKKPRGMPNSDSADPQRTLRMSDAQIAVVDEAAARLGINRSEFIRWVSYASANELLRLANEAERSK